MSDYMPNPAPRKYDSYDFNPGSNKSAVYLLVGLLAALLVGFLFLGTPPGDRGTEIARNPDQARAAPMITPTDRARTPAMPGATTPAPTAPATAVAETRLQARAGRSTQERPAGGVLPQVNITLSCRRKDLAPVWRSGRRFVQVARRGSPALPRDDIVLVLSSDSSIDRSPGSAPLRVRKT